MTILLCTCSFEAWSQAIATTVIPPKIVAVAPDAPPSASGVGEIARLAEDLQKAGDELKRLQQRLPDNLWVTLLCMQSPSTPAPEGFNFETCGSDLAQISGLDKDPQHRKVSIKPLVPNGMKAYLSATTFVY